MAAPASMDHSFSFNPSSDLLIDRYLRAKIDGRMAHLANAAYFLDADICSARPQELVSAHSMPARVPPRDAPDGQQYYFFSPARFIDNKRKSRTIDGTGGKESWHAESRPKPVQGVAGGGFVAKFSYHVKIGPKLVEKPGWIMTEYSFEGTRKGDTVLCKIYRSPRGSGRSAAPSSSAKSGCKRKAADDLEDPRPSTQPRMTDDDGDAVFASEVEDYAAAPEIEEIQNVEQSQPEQPQMVPASDTTLEDWEASNGVTTIHIPGSEGHFEAYHVKFWGGFPYHDEDLEWMRHRQTNKEEDDVLLFAGEEEVKKVQDAVQPEPQMVPMSFDPEDFEAYDETFWAGIPCFEDAGLIVGEMQNVEEAGQQASFDYTTLQVPDGFPCYDPTSRPEPQLAPESLDGSVTLEEMQNTTYEEQQNQNPTFQTVHGPMADVDLIDALAAGVTVDDLFPNDGGGPDDMLPCT